MRISIPITLRMAFDVLVEFAKTAALWLLFAYTVLALHAVSQIPEKLDMVVFRLTDQARGIAHASDQLTLLRGQQAYDASASRQQMRGDALTSETTSGVTILSLSPDIHVPFTHFATNAVTSEGIAARSRKDWHE